MKKRKIVNISWGILVAINLSPFGYLTIKAILGDHVSLILVEAIGVLLSLLPLWIINLIFMPIYIHKQNPTGGKKLISLTIIIASLALLGLVGYMIYAFSIAGMPSTR